jgi:HSP20 family protein
MWNESINFSKIFNNLTREFSTAEELLNKMFSKTFREGEAHSVGSNLPYYYGYQIRVGPDGKPHVREFGNVPSMRLVEQSKIRKPLVDTSFNEKENTYVITAEMPGVTKENIKLNVSQQTVIIRADHAGKKYLAEVPMNVELDEASPKATYTNGILELKIKTKEQPKLKSKDIRVE